MSQGNVSVSISNTYALVTQKPLRGWKLWLSRFAFLLLALLLVVSIRLGHDTYMKFLILRSTGIESSVNSEGRITLQPTDGLPAAEAGYRADDIVLAVNGVHLNSSLSVEQTIRSISLNVNNDLIMDVRVPDGTERKIKIALDEPHSSLFGLTVLQVTQYQILLDIMLVMGFSIPMLIIFWRKSSDRLGLFVAFTLLLMAFRFTNTSLYILNPLLILLGFVLYAIGRVLLLIFLFIFPDGRFIPLWTRPFAWVGGGWAALSLLFPPFYTTSGQLMDVAIFATGLWAQIYRYRRVSNRQEKQQTKWILSGLIIAYLVGYLFTLMQLLPSLRESGLTYLRFQLIGQFFFVLAILAIPVTVSISIFRHRLYEIDILINRALVYGTLTAILSGMAVAMGGFFQRLFMATTGQQSESTVIITTLIVVSAMTPIKDSLQVLVDKRFKESPDPHKKLKLFITQIHGRLFPASVQEMTRKLLEEVVLAFDVKSGAIFLDGQKPAHATRDWDGNAQIVIPVNSEGKSYGQLALGKRGNGAEYTSRDCGLLREVAQATAIAIEQDTVTV